MHTLDKCSNYSLKAVCLKNEKKNQSMIGIIEIGKQIKFISIGNRLIDLQNH